MVEITFTGIINTFFNNVVDLFTLILIIVWVAVFFVVQYYLLRFYYWVGVKFYQVYLAVSDEDIIHLLQHPSVSYNKIRNSVTTSDNSTQETNNSQSTEENKN